MIFTCSRVSKLKEERAVQFTHLNSINIDKEVSPAKERIADMREGVRSEKLEIWC